jgi:fructokinase
MTETCIRIFGEVLFDHFPDGATVLGGAPFNVAWHLQAFGEAPSFISRIGIDSQGETIIKSMQAWGMDSSELQKDAHHPTGTVQITFSQGEPRYHILPNQAYDFISADECAIKCCDGLLYHGTLALRHEISRQALENLKSYHQGKIFLDVNLRAPWWDDDHLAQWLNEADWVKLNLDEFQRLQPDIGDLAVALKVFRQTYDLEGLVVTCGAKGAIAVNMAGEHASVTPDEALTIVDTVGAGDAFAAVMIVGIYQEWPLQLALDRAQAFASAMLGQQGAIVQNKAFYQPFINAWLSGTG